jgi:hypothetical protein
MSMHIIDPSTHQPLAFRGLPVSCDFAQYGLVEEVNAVTLVTQQDSVPGTVYQANHTGPLLVFRDQDALRRWAQLVLAEVNAGSWCSCGHPANPEIPRHPSERCPVHGEE